MTNKDKDIKVIDYNEFKNKFGGNKQFKCDYLNKLIENECNVKSVNASKSIFNNSKQLEEDFGKDVYDFTQSELERLFKSFYTPKINDLQSKKSSLDKYLLYAVEQQKSIFIESPTLNIKRNRLEQLTDKDKENKMLCTENELYGSLDKVDNNQDKLLLICLWKGLFNSEFQTIRDITVDDIDWEKSIVSTINIVEDKITKRITEKVIPIKFTGSEMMILKIAVQEEWYESVNKNSKKPNLKYLNGEYVFRTYELGNNMSNMKIKPKTINDKIRRFQKDTGLMFMKAQTINVSGWVFRLLEENGYYKEYIHKDVIEFINKNDLKFNYVNFHSNVKVLQEKYRIEHEASKDSENEKQDNNVDLTEEDFLEGKKKLREHISRERKAKVIKLAKEKYKNKYGMLKCEICDFDFKSMYGETGEGFIEGHHLKPVSELLEGEKTKVEDIVLVCSNCHSMLHRRKVWLNKENLKSLLEC